MTEPGGPAWRQTIFFPFAITAHLAQGTVLRLAVECPSYQTAVYGHVPLVDAVATIDDGSGTIAFFLVNRGLETVTTVSVDLGSLTPVRLGECLTLAHDDPTAANTPDRQERVAPARNQSARIESGLLTVDLPPISWTAFELIHTNGDTHA